MIDYPAKDYTTRKVSEDDTLNDSQPRWPEGSSPTPSLPLPPVILGKTATAADCLFFGVIPRTIAKSSYATVRRTEWNLIELHINEDETPNDLNEDTLFAAIELVINEHC